MLTWDHHQPKATAQSSLTGLLILDHGSYSLITVSFSSSLSITLIFLNRSSFWLLLTLYHSPLLSVTVMSPDHSFGLLLITALYYSWSQFWITPDHSFVLLLITVLDYSWSQLCITPDHSFGSLLITCHRLITSPFFITLIFPHHGSWSLIMINCYSSRSHFTHIFPWSWLTVTLLDHTSLISFLDHD